MGSKHSRAGSSPERELGPSPAISEYGRGAGAISQRSASPYRTSTDYPRPQYADDGERQAMLPPASPHARGVSSPPPGSSRSDNSRTASRTYDEPLEMRIDRSHSHKPSEDGENTRLQQRSSSASRFTGVSLRDDGPVVSQEGGFRSVQRTRRSSQGPTRQSRGQSIIGDSSLSPPVPSKPTLPPGASHR